MIDVSGQSFADYMRDEVLIKLGMTHSTFQQPLPPDQWNLAATGNMDDPQLRPVPGQWHTYPEMAAAGLWTTAGDLARFVIDIQDTYAGRSSKVITKAMVDKMLTPVPGNKWQMGMGLLLGGSGDDAIFRSSGTNYGFQGGFTGTVRTRQGAVVLYNDRESEAFPARIIEFIAQEYAWPK